MLKDGVISLRSVDGVETILNIKKVGLISDSIANEICRDILVEACREDFFNYDVSFISILCNEVLFFDSSNKYLDGALRFVLEKGTIEESDRSLSTVRWGLGLEKISATNAVHFLNRNLEDIQSEDKILDAMAIVSELRSDMPERDSLVAAIHDHVVGLALDSLGDFIEITDALSGVGWEDTDQAEDNITKMIEEKFGELGIEITEDRARDVARSIDIENYLQNYIMNSSEPDDREPSPHFSGGPDEVDDLFDRG